MSDRGKHPVSLPLSLLEQDDFIIRLETNILPSFAFEKAYKIIE